MCNCHGQNKKLRSDWTKNVNTALESCMKVNHVLLSWNRMLSLIKKTLFTGLQISGKDTVYMVL